MKDDEVARLLGIYEACAAEGATDEEAARRMGRSLARYNAFRRRRGLPKLGDEEFRSGNFSTARKRVAQRRERDVARVEAAEQEAAASRAFEPQDVLAGEALAALGVPVVEPPAPRRRLVGPKSRVDVDALARERREADERRAERLRRRARPAWDAGEAWDATRDALNAFPRTRKAKHAWRDEFRGPRPETLRGAVAAAKFEVPAPLQDEEILQKLGELEALRVKRDAAEQAMDAALRRLMEARMKEKRGEEA